MCLAAIAVARSQRFPWVLASNRDEFFDRPSLPLAWWQPETGGLQVLSGRDLSAGGTWLGLTEAGLLALVTNVREPGRFDPTAASRGALVLDWLREASAEHPVDLPTRLQDLATPPRNGFNLYAADLVAAAHGHHPSACWASNRVAQPRHLGDGLVGLSNAALDTPWPKVTSLKQQLQAALDSAADTPSLAAAAFAALADPRPAPDADLPATGVPLLRERQLSSAFIRIEDMGVGRVYGTRCSTLVIVERQGKDLLARVIERTFASDGSVSGEVAVAWALPCRAA